MPEPSDTTPLPNQPILRKIDSTPVRQQKRQRFFERGESPFDDARTSRYFYFIMHGQIKISQINPDTGREQTLYLLERGDMFDVATLLDGQPHDYVAEVLEPVEAVEVPIDSVRKLLRDDPSFQEFFFPYMARQLRNMEELATDLSLYDVYRRLVHLFARSVDTGESPARIGSVGSLSHEEIASMVGSVRKVVNRNLQQLKKEGVITLSRKKIQLKSLKKLLDKL